MWRRTSHTASTRYARSCAYWSSSPPQSIPKRDQRPYAHRQPHRRCKAQLAHDDTIIAPTTARALPEVALKWGAGARQTLLVAGLAALLAFLISLVLGFMLPPNTLAEEMNQTRVPIDAVYDPLDYPHGFYPVEKLPDSTTYSWTNGQATLTFPYAANLGRIVHV